MCAMKHMFLTCLTAPQSFSCWQLKNIKFCELFMSSPAVYTGPFCFSIHFEYKPVSSLLAMYSILELKQWVTMYRQAGEQAVPRALLSLMCASDRCGSRCECGCRRCRHSRPQSFLCASRVIGTFLKNTICETQGLKSKCSLLVYN